MLALLKLADKELNLAPCTQAHVFCQQYSRIMPFPETRLICSRNPLEKYIALGSKNHKAKDKDWETYEWGELALRV